MNGSLFIHENYCQPYCSCVNPNNHHRESRHCPYKSTHFLEGAELIDQPTGRDTRCSQPSVRSVANLSSSQLTITHTLALSGKTAALAEQREGECKTISSRRFTKVCLRLKEYERWVKIKYITVLSFSSCLLTEKSDLSEEKHLQLWLYAACYLQYFYQIHEC